MIPAQSIQVIINVIMLLIAGWLGKLGLDEDSAAALCGALGAIVLAIVLATLQRKRLLETPPPPKTGDGATGESGRNFPPLGAFMLPMLIVIGLFGAPGCHSIDRISLEADRARYEAIEPLVVEHVERHPLQAASWSNFMSAWRQSIDARAKLVAD
jgi:hypothetical protein